MIALDLGAQARAQRRTLRAAAEDLAGALMRRGATEVHLFGSLADEVAWVGPSSDVDLAVVMPGVDGVRFHRRLADVPEVQRFRHALDLLVYTPAEWERLRHGRGFVRDEIVERGCRLGE